MGKLNMTPGELSALHRRQAKQDADEISVHRDKDGQWWRAGPCGAMQVYTGESAEILDVLFRRGKHDKD